MRWAARARLRRGRPGRPRPALGRSAPASSATPVHSSTPSPAPQLPCDKLFELPGRPNVVYTLKDYSVDRAKGAAEARAEAGFMFKAFETGQIGPRRLERMLGANAPRNATIHEYLDWVRRGVGVGWGVGGGKVAFRGCRSVGLACAAGLARAA
jgi:hypothetical protein